MNRHSVTTNYAAQLERPVFAWAPLDNLPETDGMPMDTSWHRLAMNLLIEAVIYLWRDRKDFYVGGNMLFYFSPTRRRARQFLGPDFFFVWGVDRDRLRRYWAVWEEGGKFPNVIIELLSPTTAKADRTTKKRLYERTFKTPEYFLYDPDTGQFQAWRLNKQGRYRAVKPDERNWVWSEQLGLWLGTWQGKYLEFPDLYPRFFDRDGNLVLIAAEAAEAEVARLRAQLAGREGKQRRGNGKRS